MNTAEQELSARHHLRWRKALYVASFLGVGSMIWSRAVPWDSSGLPDSIMGRAIPGSAGLIGVAALHLALCIAYGFVIASVVYRFSLLTALVVGQAIGLLLYLLNFCICARVLNFSDSNEISVLLTHLVFALFFTAGYKAISVPSAHRRSHVSTP